MKVMAQSMAWQGSHASWGLRERASDTDEWVPSSTASYDGGQRYRHGEAGGGGKAGRIGKMGKGQQNTVVFTETKVVREQGKMTSDTD